MRKIRLMDQKNPPPTDTFLTRHLHLTLCSFHHDPVIFFNAFYVSNWVWFKLRGLETDYSHPGLWRKIGKRCMLHLQTLLLWLDTRRKSKRKTRMWNLSCLERAYMLSTHDSKRRVDKENKRVSVTKLVITTGNDVALGVRMCNEQRCKWSCTRRNAAVGSVLIRTITKSWCWVRRIDRQQFLTSRHEGEKSGL